MFIYPEKVYILLYHIMVYMANPFVIPLRTHYDRGLHEIIIEDAIRVEFFPKGRKMEKFAIIYYTVIEGEEHQVVRYDCSHDFAHKDLLYLKPVEKVPLPHLRPEVLVDLAVDEIHDNWRTYKKKYIQLMK